MAFTIGGYGIPQLRKAIVAVLGTAVYLVNDALDAFAGFVPVTVADWVGRVTVVATAAGVFLVRNAVVIDGVGSGGYGNVPDVFDREADARVADSSYAGKHRAE